MQTSVVENKFWEFGKVVKFDATVKETDGVCYVTYSNQTNAAEALKRTNEGSVWAAEFCEDGDLHPENFAPRRGFQAPKNSELSSFKRGIVNIRLAKLTQLTKYEQHFFISMRLGKQISLILKKVILFVSGFCIYDLTSYFLSIYLYFKFVSLD